MPLDSQPHVDAPNGSVAFQRVNGRSERPSPNPKPASQERPPAYITCPYLGLEDDPDTAMSFAAPWNYCHYVQPATPVKVAHQQHRCLTATYTSCPIYQQRTQLNLPHRRRMTSKRPRRMVRHVWRQAVGMTADSMVQVWQMTAVPMQKWWRRQAKPRVQGWVNARNMLTFFIAFGFIIIGLGVLILGWQYQDALAAMLFGEDPPPTAIPAVADGADLGLVLATATATPTMTPSATPSPTPPPTATASATPSATPSPTAALCPLPEGWIAIALSEGVTLELLAQAYELDPAELAAQNCQSVADFGADGVVYVPVLRPTATPTAMVTTLATVSATATATAATGGIPVVEITPIAPLATAVVVACGAPSGWVLYTVQAQDNLFRIALNSGSTVAQLQQANCLGGSTHVRTGQQLYVPQLPVTAVPTDTPPPDTEPDP